MIGVMNVIFEIICMMIAVFGVWGVAVMLNGIKNNQEYIIHRLDIIEEQLSGRGKEQ